MAKVLTLDCDVIPAVYTSVKVEEWDLGNYGFKKRRLLLKLTMLHLFDTFFRIGRSML